ncbi:MAG TPA: FABP family protein, partial [Acidimicrobiales bacterium]|nr:FABP family protein [Acidimicrobiales bacterium]
MTTPEASADLGVLEGLVGHWRGESAGLWNPADPIVFDEEVFFGQVGKPWLSYRQQTYRQGGPASHGESGYLIPAGPGRVEWTIAQPSGIVEVHAGTACLRPRPAADPPAVATLLAVLA